MRLVQTKWPKLKRIPLYSRRSFYTDFFQIVDSVRPFWCTVFFPICQLWFHSDPPITLSNITWRMFKKVFLSCLDHISTQNEDPHWKPHPPTHPVYLLWSVMNSLSFMLPEFQLIWWLPTDHTAFMLLSSFIAWRCSSFINIICNNWRIRLPQLS